MLKEKAWMWCLKPGRHPSVMIAVCTENILILKDTYRLLWREEYLSGTKLEEKNKEMNENIMTAHIEHSNLSSPTKVHKAFCS